MSWGWDRDKIMASGSETVNYTNGIGWDGHGILMGWGGDLHGVWKRSGGDLDPEIFIILVQNIFSFNSSSSSDHVLPHVCPSETLLHSSTMLQVCF